MTTYLCIVNGKPNLRRPQCQH